MPMSLLEFKQLLETLESFKVVTDWMLSHASTPASSFQALSAQQKKSPGKKKRTSSGLFSSCSSSPNKNETLSSSPSAQSRFDQVDQIDQVRRQLLEALEAFDGDGSKVTAALTALKAIALSKEDAAGLGVANRFDVVSKVLKTIFEKQQDVLFKKVFGGFKMVLTLSLPESAPAKEQTVKDLIKKSLFTTAWIQEEAQFFQTLRIYESSSDPVTAADCMKILTAMGVQEYPVWMQALLPQLAQNSAATRSEPESELKLTTDHNKTVGALAVVQPAGAAAAQPLPQMPQPNSLSSDKNIVVSDAVAQLTAKDSPEPGKAADARAVVLATDRAKSADSKVSSVFQQVDDKVGESVTDKAMLFSSSSDGAKSSAQQSFMNPKDLASLPASGGAAFSAQQSLMNLKDLAPIASSMWRILLLNIGLMLISVGAAVCALQPYWSTIIAPFLNHLILPLTPTTVPIYIVSALFVGAWLLMAGQTFSYFRRFSTDQNFLTASRKSDHGSQNIYRAQLMGTIKALYRKICWLIMLGLCLSVLCLSAAVYAQWPLISSVFLSSSLLVQVLMVALPSVCVVGVMGAMLYAGWWAVQPYQAFLSKFEVSNRLDKSQADLSQGAQNLRPQQAAVVQQPNREERDAQVRKRLAALSKGTR